jgi:hypothetical protein
VNISHITHIHCMETIPEFFNVKRNGTSTSPSPCHSARQLYRRGTTPLPGHSETAVVLNFCHKTDKFSIRTFYLRDEERYDVPKRWQLTSCAEIRPERLMNIRLEHLQPQILLCKVRNSRDIKMSMAVHVVRIALMTEIIGEHKGS